MYTNRKRAHHFLKITYSIGKKNYSAKGIALYLHLYKENVLFHEILIN